MKLSAPFENYCILFVDRGMTKKDAYKAAVGKNHKSPGALRAAIARFHNKKIVKQRIKELQEELNQIRKESIKETIKQIPYDKKKAFDDYILMRDLAYDKKNAKAGVSAIDSIVKLLGLAEETAGEVVFKILKDKEKDVSKNNKSPS
jgi:predicted transcriptional regulator